MKALSEWFVRNPVAANLLALLVMAGGLVTLVTIRIEGFPRIPPSYISVDIAYPDASAEQVDEGISRKVEKAIEGLAGVKKVLSLSREDSAQILVQKEPNADMLRLLNDVKNRVDGIATLPQKSERPVVTVDELKGFVLLIQMSGDVNEAVLQRSARLVKQELSAHPRISKIESFGKKGRELRVELDAERLRAFGLSVSDVAGIVARNLSQTGFGKLESRGAKLIIRSDARLSAYDQVAALPLMTIDNGAKVFLRDVADIVDGYEDTGVKAWFQGTNSVGFVLYTSSKGHMIQVSDAAHEVADRLRRQLPPAVHLDIWGDYSLYMKERLVLLQANAFQGLVIVFAILALFLNVKLAFWVAMGIPFSIAGTVALMGESFLDYSLNDITTFGMIIVLGILVDDAVVVGESVFEERKREGDPVKGTLRGVHKVAVATVFGTLTTIAAFYPLTLIQNDFGKILASFSTVVCLALFFSLLESKLVLPAHLASVSVTKAKAGNLPGRWYESLRNLSSKGLSAVNRKIYAPLLHLCLAHRYTALAGFIFLALVSGWLIRMNLVSTVFFPDIPGDVIMVTAEMEKGMPAKLAERNAGIIQNAANSLNRELMTRYGTDQPPIPKIMVAVGGDGTIEAFAELQPQGRRVVRTMDLLRAWRERTAGLEGVESIQFSGNAETGGGFVIKVSSRNPEELALAVSLLKRGLSGIGGVHDIRDNISFGESEIRLSLKDEARHLGLSPADLAAQIGAAFGGVTVDKFQKGEDEVKLKVVRKKHQRQYIYQLINTRIRLSGGASVPLPMVAGIKFKRSPGEIRRENGRRVAEIKAAIDKEGTSAEGVFEALQQKVIPEIKTAVPGVDILPGGELSEGMEIRGGLIKALVMVMILIYALLAVPLKSYWKPVVIMSVIPFGFAGAVAGHFIAGVPLSVLSFFGMLALAGIVVNDSLVMLTRFNDLLTEGCPVGQALKTAGTSRFKAIFLTTATTVCGLAPLLFETSEQAQYLIPAAVSLAYGELFATGVTLLLIPVLMNIAYDIRALVRGA